MFLDKIKQRNRNLLAGDFAWFDRKFRSRLRQPSFNSFARTIGIVVSISFPEAAILLVSTKDH